ncbi:MAG: preprotein translocase subunit SecA, partial [Candidatus Desulforudaceae bacterium]
MLGFLKNILDDNAREIKKLQRVITETNNLESKIQGLSDAELQGMTPRLKERLAIGDTLDDILPEAFAVVREASRRVLGMRHFDVQLLGGTALHQG